MHTIHLPGGPAYCQSSGEGVLSLLQIKGRKAHSAGGWEGVFQ